MAIAIPEDKPMIHIYACGGTGYNIGYQLLNAVRENPILRSTVTVTFLDTSTANDHELNTPENTMILGSGNGSGKIRGENAGAIMDSMTAALHKHKPGLFNIAIGSASGGTGSTIMNCLTGAMLERGIIMPNFIVGSRDSGSEIKNTNKTFQSFANMASLHGRPVLVHYRENSAENTKEKINNIIGNNVLLTCLLFSGKDDKMDVSDINNFLNYPAVTNFPASIVGFDLFRDAPSLAMHEVMLTVASLGTTGADTSVTPTPEYQAAGRISSEVSNIFKDTSAMHWVTLGNTFGPMMKDLAVKSKEFDDAAKAIKLETFVSQPPASAASALVI